MKKQLVKGATLTGAPVAIYTCPAGKVAEIDLITLDNPAGGTINVTLWVANAAPVNANRIFRQGIGGNTTASYAAVDSAIIEAGYSLYAAGNTAGINVFGDENLIQN